MHQWFAAGMAAVSDGAPVLNHGISLSISPILWLVIRCSTPHAQSGHRVIVRTMLPDPRRCNNNWGVGTISIEELRPAIYPSCGCSKIWDFSDLESIHMLYVVSHTLTGRVQNSGVQPYLFGPKSPVNSAIGFYYHNSNRKAIISL